MKNNWCIAVEQTQENKIVNYWKLEKNIVFHIPILYMNIYIVDFIVSDQLTNERMFKLRDVFVDKGWITGLNFISGEGIRSGTNYTRALKHYNGKPIFEFPAEQIIKILDSNISI